MRYYRIRITNLTIFVEVLDLTKNNIVFYDGDCGFCNTSVQFILKRRKNNSIYFTPLQSDFAIDTLKKNQKKINLDTIYFLRKGKMYDKSSAAFQMAKQLKWPYPLAVVFYIVPRLIRDGVYDYIANRRHKLKRGFCVIPNEEEKQFFI
jgi:predicted DCC family thiol-disulfide oxidoreductase YuxK